MPPSADTPRDLLFGLLALQNGLVNQPQLVAAFAAWTASPGRAMADLLVEQGAMTAPRRAVIEALLAEHLAAHGGDAERSLAAIPVGPTTRQSLAGLGDAALRRRVEDLLAAPTSTFGGDDEAADRAAGGPSVEHTVSHVGSSTGPAGDPNRTSTDSVGSANGDGQRFRILRPHAKGGLGAVFVALDGELYREVALKRILDQHADDPVSRQRFLLEAEITGNLEHPGIVPVYGLGTYPGGRPFYAMRFIRGDSLKEAIEQHHAGAKDRTGLELRRLLHRFLDICNAIDYAHSRGVLHRDIKPANVIVGKHGETLVVDWGLAKPLGRVEPGVDAGERTLVPSSAVGSAETLPGSALGTPAFMSPEQAAGELEKLSPRSDVYSLGATLYCLLTGRPPFEGDVFEIIAKVRRGEVVPPRALDPTIDPALEAVCLKAMSTRPEDRYPGARALAEDVERWTADEPVTAWREPLARQVRRWMRRHRTGVSAAAVALVAVTGGLAAVLGVQARANRDLTAANAALADAGERERQRFALALEAIGAFRATVSEEELLKEPRFERLRARLLRGASDFYGKLEAMLRGQTDRQSRGALARAYFEIGKLTSEIGSKERALDVHRRALALRQALASEPGAGVDEQAAVGLSHQAIGRVDRDLGRINEGLAEQLRAAEILEAVSKARPDDPQSVYDLEQSYDSLMHFYGDSARWADMLEVSDRALPLLLAMARARPGDNRFPVEAARTLFDRGVASSENGRTNEALESWDRAIGLLRDVLGSEPDHAEARLLLGLCGHMRGWCLQRAGRQDAAMAAFKAAGDVLGSLVSDYPSSFEYRLRLAEFLGDFAVLLDGLGRRPEAIVAAGRCQELGAALARTNPGPPRVAILEVFSNVLLARMLARSGRRDEVPAPVERAQATLRKLEHRTDLTANILYNIACSHAVLSGLASLPGSRVSVDSIRAETDQAMEMLRRATVAGFRDSELIRQDPDLEPLRPRADFQVLLMDLAFPVDPFASAH